MNEEKIYTLLGGQKLTAEELKKLQAIQPVIVRWMTDDEMKEAIERIKDE
ncbi:MAG: hypothetical protein JNN04_09945 [Cyclobacteriaceae bacterium]|nr:hypothetical protein [Cyclobacteriaceae bacterium]